MLRYLIKKLITLILLLFLVSITVFSVLFILPGDPAQIILGINATPEVLANLRAELGLDKSFMGQYLDWIGNLLRGRSQQSIHYKMPVFELILGSLAVTGPMALIAMGKWGGNELNYASDLDAIVVHDPEDRDPAAAAAAAAEGSAFRRPAAPARPGSD